MSKKLTTSWLKSFGANLEPKFIQKCIMDSRFRWSGPYLIHLLICTNFHRKERFLLHEDKPGKWSYKLARCRRQSNQKDTRRGLLRVFDYRLPSHEIYLKEERERKYTQKKKKKSSQNYHFFFMCPNSFRLFISTSRCKCLW